MSRPAVRSAFLFPKGESSEYEGEEYERSESLSSDSSHSGTSDGKLILDAESASC